MVRILIVAALIAASLFVVKENGVLTRSGLMGYCTSVATPAGTDGSWRACHNGRLSGRPSLSLDACQPQGRNGEIEYWRCPAAVSARLGS
jgi:hypothetical protein